MSAIKNMCGVVWFSWADSSYYELNPLKWYQIWIVDSFSRLYTMIEKKGFILLKKNMGCMLVGQFGLMKGTHLKAIWVI